MGYVVHAFARGAAVGVAAGLANRAIVSKGNFEATFSPGAVLTDAAIGGVSSGVAAQFGGAGRAASSTTISKEVFAAEEGGALSTYRVTAPGETFIRYESGASAFSRVTSEGGLLPETYAAGGADGLLPQGALNRAYNLPSPEIPRVNAFEIRPPAGTPIIGPRPVLGGTGTEVIFPFGAPPGSVAPVVPVRPGG